MLLIHTSLATTKLTNHSNEFLYCNSLQNITDSRKLWRNRDLLASPCKAMAKTTSQVQAQTQAFTLLAVVGSKGPFNAQARR